MTLILQPERNIESFETAVSLRNKIIWDRMQFLTVGCLLGEWLETLNFLTKKNYLAGVNRLSKMGLLNPMAGLQAFALVNHDAIVDRIKQISEWQEASRQARAALYISFTRFLGRKFPAIFKKATPLREGTDKTFFKIREKVVTEAMNLSQWTEFFKVLQKLNPRDALLAKITLQGGKRIGEVLALKTDQIDWIKREITFNQSKTMGTIKQTVITYPETIMRELKEYIGCRQGVVFISNNGKNLALNQFARTFSAAGKIASIPFKVTPRVLRASCVTYLRQQGFSDSDIQKVSGHASSAMVNAYDKSCRADNASKKISLVG